MLLSGSLPALSKQLLFLLAIAKRWLVCIPSSSRINDSFLQICVSVDLLWSAYNSRYSCVSWHQNSKLDRNNTDWLNLTSVQRLFDWPSCAIHIPAGHKSHKKSIKKKGKFATQKTENTIVYILSTEHKHKYITSAKLAKVHRMS